MAAGNKLIYPNWRVRYAYDKKFGNAPIINNDVGIDKRTVTPTEDGLYSSELGNVVETDKDIRQYSCTCGKLHFKTELGDICDECKTECKETFGIDLDKYGWIIFGNYNIIQPAAYEMIKTVIGAKNLEKILKFQVSIGIEGNQLDISQVRQKVIPYQNIGLIEFKNNFEEIMKYYGTLNGSIKPVKAEKADFLIKMKQRIFSNKMPVFSSLLRPAYASSKKRMFSYDKLNSYLTSVLSNAKLLNNGTSKRLKNGGDKLLLWSIQEAIQSYYHMTISTKLSGKSKVIRNTILSTRTSFSSRAVICPLTDPKYIGMDHCVMNYKQFIEIFTPLILNCMMRGIGNPKFRYMTLFKLVAYLKKAKYSHKIDEDIYFIVEYLINNHKQGLWTLIDRNPTMDLGSEQMLRIVHVTKDADNVVTYIPLTSLAAQVADFDGDVENFYAPMELQVVKSYIDGFNPRYLLLDRTGDNLIDTNFLPIKDAYVNMNRFLTPIES